MDRQQLIIAIAATLFAAFLLGWLAAWVIHRLTRAPAADTAGLAARLREAEVELARRNDALQAAEAALDETRTEIEELRDYIEQRLARAKGTP